MNENFRVALAVGNMVGIVELVQLFFYETTFSGEKEEGKGTVACLDAGSVTSVALNWFSKISNAFIFSQIV